MRIKTLSALTLLVVASCAAPPQQGSAVPQMVPVSTLPGSSHPVLGFALLTPDGNLSADAVAGVPGTQCDYVVQYVDEKNTVQQFARTDTNFSYKRPMVRLIALFTAKCR